MKYQKLNLYKKMKRNIYTIPRFILWHLIGKPMIGTFIPGTFWRKLILRIFGAKIGKGGNIKPFIRISEPWNLLIGDLGTNKYIDK